MARRRERRTFTDEEAEALRELLQGRRPSRIGAYAALVAAVATLWSAVAATAFAVWDRLANGG